MITKMLADAGLLRLCSPAPYILVFIISFILGIAGTGLMQWFSKKANFIDNPSEQKFHSQKTALGGGIPIFIAFSFSLFLTGEFSTPQKGIIIGGFITLLIGLMDDLKKDFIPATVKLFILFGLTFLVTWKFEINLDLFKKIFFLNMIFTLFWIVGIISSWNASDNMDGLAPGNTVIASIAFMLVALDMNNWWMALTAVALAGSTLGFLPFNLSSKRKIFLGDCGSYFIGYTLATMGVLGEWTPSTMISCVIPVLILAIPIFDLCYTILHRHRKGVTKNIFQAINHSAPDHLSHRLVALGFSPKKAVFFLWTLGSCLALSGILLRSSTELLNTLICLIQSLLILLLILILIRLSENKLS